MKLSVMSMMTAALALGAPCPIAAAQEAPRGYVPVAEQNRVGVEYDFVRGHEKTLPPMLTGDVVAQIRVARRFFVDADVPGAILGSAVEGDLVYGNPMLGVHYAGHMSAHVSFFVGLAVGVPVAGASRSELVDQFAFYVTMTRAWHDPYRFLPHMLPVIARGGVELDYAPAFARLDLSPGLLAGLHGASGSYVDTAASLGVRARFGLEGGVRGQGTFVLSEAEDDAQTAIEPFIGYASPTPVGVYVRYGLLVALDEPLGIGPDSVGVVTHRASMGAKF